MGQQGRDCSLSRGWLGIVQLVRQACLDDDDDVCMALPIQNVQVVMSTNAIAGISV